ncbi:MAG: hypothetical protein RCG15_06695 [Candidatus Rickettsia vulgarisii]
MDKALKKYIISGRGNLIMVYILFLCGIVAPLLPVIGVIFAYINKDVQDRNLSSHYIFLIRTFWVALIGSLVSACTLFILFLGALIYLCLLSWYILRVAIGLKYLLNSSGHPNYMTYWIK